MKPISILAILGLVSLVGCGRLPTSTPAPAPTPESQGDSLVEARKGFVTKLKPSPDPKEAVAKPPRKIFDLVQYDSKAGKLAAYLTPDPKDDKKHPAIVWITGGDCNSIDQGCWTKGPPANDQSASAFREAGIVMMFPSLRGGNDNPGQRESFLGEVDDVIAATDFLIKQAYVDAKRIYLGGHSTGGTLVLLTSECTDRYRAVFSFGPVGDVAGYGPQYLHFDTSNPREVQLRSPGKWLSAIKSPVFVMEGTLQGNVSELNSMAKASKNPQVQFFPVQGASHFSVLVPITQLLAKKIVKDDGPTSNLTLTKDEVNAPFKR